MFLVAISLETLQILIYRICSPSSGFQWSPNPWM